MPDTPPSPTPALREGRVVRATGSWYEVRTENETVQARVRGKFRLEERDVTNPVAVGDRVVMRMDKDGTGLITDRGALVPGKLLGDLFDFLQHEHIGFRYVEPLQRMLQPDIE